jgi:hypothetical protein
LVHFIARQRGDRVRGISSRAITDSRGSFELAVAPNTGHVVVRAANDDFVLSEMTADELFLTGIPGGQRFYAHRFVSCDPQPGASVPDLRIALRRGVTLRGRIVGPDGEVVEDVWIMSLTVLAPWPSAWRAWQGEIHAEAVHGRFELHGLDPDAETPVCFFHPRRKLGTCLYLSGKSAAGGPLTVRLEPCGTAAARLLDGQGHPISNYCDQGIIWMNMTPRQSLPPQGAGATPLVGSGDSLFTIDPINYPKVPQTDVQGRITFPALIPGATYKIADETKVRVKFAVKPGETRDLGDIPFEKAEE